MKKRKRFFIVMTVLLLMLLAVFTFTLCWGTYKMTPSEVFKTLMGKGTRMQKTAVMKIRLPRILTGMGVAAGFAAAGAVLQTVTKNDLADTGIIGINAGAAVTAVIFITYSTGVYYNELGQLSVFVLPFLAMAGAGITSAVLYLMSSDKGMLKPKRLLLIGIGLNAGLNALITFITYRGSAGEYNRVLTWTSGSLWGSGWNYAKVLLPIILICLVVVFINHKKLDVLNLSDESAVSLGINLEKTRRGFLALSVILAGTATAFAGNIAFLGLIAPHIAKKLTGPYHRHFVPAAVLISMIIVIAADAVSRNLFSPVEIPAGITVSIFGVPYFIYLMIKET